MFNSGFRSPESDRHETQAILVSGYAGIGCFRIGGFDEMARAADDGILTFRGVLRCGTDRPIFEMSPRIRHQSPGRATKCWIAAINHDRTAGLCASVRAAHLVAAHLVADR